MKNKKSKLIFILISIIVLCSSIALALSFSFRNGNEEEARAELNSNQWYEIKYEAFTPNTFPSNITSETSVTQKVYNTYTEIKFSEENYFTTNWINFRNFVVGDNIRFIIWFYNDLSTQNGLRSTKYLSLVINKNRNTGVLSAYAEFKQRTSYNASWSNATINTPKIKLGTDWTSTQDINDENINWCISEFINQTTYTIYSGYYLFPQIETIHSNAVNITFPSNSATLISFNQTIDNELTPTEVTRNYIPLISLNIVDNILYANNNIIIAGNTSFAPIFPCLYLASNFTTLDVSIYQFLLQFYEIDENYIDLFAEQLVPPARALESASRIAYNEGYDDGIGQNIISDSTEGVISALFHGLFGNIFQIEIIPNFPLYIFILIPVVFAVLSLILWLMRGK